MFVSILIAVAGWAGGAQPAPTAPAEVRRHPLYAERPDTWPAPASLTVRATPDWSDHGTYPPAARRLELEGAVTIEMGIDTAGVPRACRILVSSGHVILDDATCDRALEMRFEPLRGPDGRAVETAYRARVNWLLTDPTAFDAGQLVVRFELSGDQILSCRAERSGAAPEEWQRFACRSLGAALEHYLGDAFGRAERATIVVSIEPAGAAPTAASAGRRIGHRRIAFDVDSEGSASNCRKILDRGFGPAPRDYSDACGLFLSRAWLEAGRGEPAPRSGTLDLGVYVEEPR